MTRYLSPHFTLAELTVTTRSDGQDVDRDGDRTEPFPNVPSTTAIIRLESLCVHVLEPIRALLGVPLKVTSGYRSPALNSVIKGSKTSQHMRGEAADCVPLGMDLEVAFEKIANAIRTGDLPADQAIVYGKGGFFHVSYTMSRTSRREVLRSLAAGGSGGPYERYETAG